VEKAVRAVRLGAFDFIEKPPEAERILLAVANALRLRTLEAENRRLAEEAGLGRDLLGSSPPMRILVEQIRLVAATEAGVLVLGENGTGKELVARAIHDASPRRRRALVPVNCAAIPETLFESELFGHARGAFTGATEPRRGKFQQADGGTLFLDEVGEIPLALQPKLLRALESNEVERVGGQGAERVNVRVVAATNRDLVSEVAAGRFREDLYYRLLVVPIRVPALRERGEDAIALAAHFLEAACRRNRTRSKALDESAHAAIRAHAWPGNVRELRNAMERIAILVPGEMVSGEHLSALHGGGPATTRSKSSTPPPAEKGASGDPDAGTFVPHDRREPFDLAAELERYERALILHALERARWRMTAAARFLGLERSHLYKKLKALGIERPVED